MSLNIKDREVHHLAQAITKITGETLTSAVKTALEERYERLQNRRTRVSASELVATGRRASASLKRPYLDHAELLYDENGLPK